MRRQLHHAGAVAATPGGKAVFDQAALEVVVVVGTNVHDNTYGNKLMFLAQAVGAIRTKYAKDAYLSLLVFPDGYADGEIAEAKKSALGYNGNTVFVSLGSKDELVSYLNTRTVDGSYDYRANERILLREVRVFSHGLPSVLAFGLDLGDPRASALSFGKGDVANLKAEAWNPGASLSSYACRTGNVAWDSTFDDTWRDVAKPGESLGQELARQLGVRVRGYVTRSNYQPTYADKRSRFQSSLDPAYNADYVDLADPATTGNNAGQALWNHRGAFQEPVSGKTPAGLNENGAGGVWIFEKDKDPRQE